MDANEFVLAVTPPAVVIVLEAFSPLSHRFFAKQAEQIIKDEIGQLAVGPGKAAVAQALSASKLLLEHSMAGAASLAGLAPTFVSFIMSGLAIFFVLDNPYWWTVGLVVSFLVLSAVVLRILSARSLFDLNTVEISVIRLRSTSVFSFLVYATNISLILVATGIYVEKIG